MTRFIVTFWLVTVAAMAGHAACGGSQQVDPNVELASVYRRTQEVCVSFPDARATTDDCRRAMRAIFCGDGGIWDAGVCQ